MKTKVKAVVDNIVNALRIVAELNRIFLTF